jgi:hypothetical protein
MAFSFVGCIRWNAMGETRQRAIVAALAAPARCRQCRDDDVLELFEVVS